MESRNELRKWLDEVEKELYELQDWGIIGLDEWLSGMNEVRKLQKIVG